VGGPRAGRRSTPRPPWAALTDFYQQALTGYARQRVMENFALTWAVPDLGGIHQLRLVIEELCARATDLLRPGVTADDLRLLLVSLGYAVQITDECRPQMWKRLLRRISFDGLRADPREPLPPMPHRIPTARLRGAAPSHVGGHQKAPEKPLASAMGR
jgi:hypothetical protein